MTWCECVQQTLALILIVLLRISFRYNPSQCAMMNSFAAAVYAYFYLHRVFCFVCGYAHFSCSM